MENQQDLNEEDGPEEQPNKENQENINNNQEMMINNNIYNNQEEEQLAQEENELMYIYEWVDSIQLSRPKKNIRRDFSDGLLLAEIIKNYLPRLVDLHNYPSCTGIELKRTNWNVLNQKVLKKIGIKLSKAEIDDIVTIKPLAIEHLLERVYNTLVNKVGVSNNDINKEINLKKILTEKDNIIRQLKDIVEVLEMKLKNSEDMERTLENKINKLTNAIRNKGIEV